MAHEHDGPTTNLTVPDREWIEQRIRDEFDRDREVLRNVFAIASKIIWAAASVLAIIVAVAGFTTVREVKNTITRTAEKQVAAALRAEDPHSAYSLARDHLVDRTILDSYVVNIARNDVSPTIGQKYPDDAARERMYRLITDPATDEYTFKDALNIYFRIDSRDPFAFQKAGALFGEMLTAARPYEWMRNDRRRIHLLEQLQSTTQAERAQSGILSILKDGDVSREILDAALLNVTQHPGPVYSAALEDIYKRPDPPPLALPALAACNSRAPEVGDFVRRAEDIGYALEHRDSFWPLICVYMNPSVEFDTETGKQARNLLRLAITRAQLGFLVPRSRPQAAFAIAYLDQPRIVRNVNGTFVSYEPFLTTMMTLLREAATARDGRTIGTYIRACVDVPDSDTPGLPMLYMPMTGRRGQEVGRSFVAVSLSTGGVINLRDRAPLSQNEAQTIVFGITNHGEIVAHWTANGIERQAEVVAFPNPDRLIFLLNKGPSKDADDEPRGIFQSSSS
jgi:hypothetical protein